MDKVLTELSPYGSVLGAVSLYTTVAIPSFKKKEGFTSVLSVSLSRSIVSAVLRFRKSILMSWCRLGGAGRFCFM